MNLLQQLPFYPENRLAIISEFEINELLREGFIGSKLATDGILGFHAVKFATSNAKEMARYFELVLGFKEIAYRGLETSSPLLGSHVLRNGNATLEFVNNLHVPNGRKCSAELHKLISYFIKGPNSVEMACLAAQFEPVRSIFLKGACSATLEETVKDAATAWDIHRFISRHGMGVFDVSFEVADVDEMFERAIKNGAIAILTPTVESDGRGDVKMATIGVPGSDIRHTLIQILRYRGCYLPNYSVSNRGYRASKHERPELCDIDHCVQNYSWNELVPYSRFYAAALGLHKFWSVDDKDVSTGNTALRSIVMASANGRVKMPINEPAKGKMKGQIEEFYDFYGGPGVQHVAFLTRDIVSAVDSLKARGLKFNHISEEYYKELEAKLTDHKIELKENLDQLKKRNILVDFDPATKYLKPSGSYACNYLLQIFTEPLHDRPTFFIEIIQRHRHNGFGKGTFKGLFESIELQQKLRGTLSPSE